MVETSWLIGLNPGSAVIVDSRYSDEISEVVRVTPTQVILPGDVRFRKNDGRIVGKSYSGARLKEATPDAVAVIDLRVKAHYLRDIREWQSLPAQVIEQVYAVVKAWEANK